MIRVVLTKKNGRKLLILGIDKDDMAALTSRIVTIEPDDELDFSVCLIYRETVADVLDTLRGAGVEVPHDLRPGGSLRSVPTEMITPVVVTCPSCRAKHDAVSSVRHAYPPEPNDIFICFDCGAINQWDGGKLLSCNLDEISDLPPRDRAAIERHAAMVKARKPS